ncbi:uncharacterized protein [Chironomus tepperi]|uniref:uncharacterized protein n=1 Tax=Chironomus tepperi TaxID=113505 RepID=UPI00391F6AB1
MWGQFFVIQVLIILFAYPYQSSSSTNLPSFIRHIGNIKSSKKSSSYCTSSDIKFNNKHKKGFSLLDLQSCDNSLDIVTAKLPKILNDSPTCFVVVIRSNVTDKNFEMKLIDVMEEEASRPIILNFYRKSEGTEKFYVIDKSKTRTKTNKSVEYATNFINKVISYDYDVESQEFSSTRSKILKHAMTNGCSVCISFAQLIDYRFTWYLKIHDDEIDDLNCDIDCFRALLNFPYDFNFDSSYKDVYELFFSYYIDLIRDTSMSATSIDKTEYTVKDFLEDTEVRLDMDGLAGLAWKEEEYQVFEFLIRADLPFPDNFIHDRVNELSYGLSKNKYVKSLENYIQELEGFHRHIQKGKLRKVKMFLSSHPHLPFGRNIDNKSALKAAFDSNQLEIFSYLKSQGMSFSNFKEVAEYSKVKNQYKDNKRKQLRQFNRKFLKPAIEVDLITKLMQKSSFTYDHHVHDEDEIKYTIQRSYEKIKSTVQEILEIAAASNELQINFDFTNSDLVEFDPYINEAYGAAYNYYDFVIIAAKDLLSKDVDKKNYALGTISHELMHYTMHQIYQNNINPYDEKDYERRKIMKDIYRKYEAIKEEDKLINTAYNHEEDESNYGELIARVPDILFTYRDNQTHLEVVKKTFKDLFKFYDQYVLADMREFIPTIHTREKVRELNSWLDLVSEIEEYDVEHTKEEETDTEDDEDDENKIDAKKDEKVEEEDREDEVELPEIKEIQEYLDDDSQQRLKVFTSENPKLMLQKLYYKLRKSKTIAIYVASSFSYYGNFEQVMYKIDTIHPSVPLIINCDRVKRLKKFVQLLQKTTFRKVVAIADKNEFENGIKTKELKGWMKETKF